MSLGAAAAVTGAATLAAYLNAKWHIAKDIQSLRNNRYVERQLARAAAQGRANIWFIFQETVQQYPDMIAIWSREGSYTYRQAYDLACQYAQFFLSRGMKPGEIAALFLHNRAEFLIAWLALVGIGCAPAAINYNLSGDALVHCLTVSGAKLVLVDGDAECSARIEESRAVLEDAQGLGMQLVILDTEFHDRLAAFPTSDLPERLALNMHGDFPAILLYTSGTTGLPKASAFTMGRFYRVVYSRQGVIGDVAGPNGDRWYSCMPLYHGTGAVAIMGAFVGGVGVALGRRFSVRTFWADVRDSQATIIIYVGEAARYLLAAPPSPDDRNHRVRCMYGNGLRPEVWEQCRERFGIAAVAEFFNSTEGMFGLFNFNQGPYLAGCVGHHGLLLRTLLHKTYVPVAIDPATGDVQRDAVTGFATRVPYATGGEILVALPHETAFQGYWGNAVATERKLLRDVFRHGDVYYRTGDALRRAPDGRWFFLDRLGDTFRWKSENVSTAEVSAVLGHYPGVIEANVYGVRLPHYEGRAGCAALHIRPELLLSKTFDFAALARHARSKLPNYAVPVFLRLTETPAHSHNHKQNKTALRDEGVDPALLGSKVTSGQKDRILWLKPAEEGYVDFSQEDWESIQRGETRL
ncbi:hypothetical protein ASPZODRAFT_145805 [Penicilliopsis zonata CBS 506.65]|uniref:Very long-chain fatty acid transport protein n=1 Tax=Penicilliopsis zonata CBS 506.65 TaxID=1073090 RepID=A0A1L9S9R4_9EURO|nr:hypothetical protein ASPZODRAFT_145805 [Penicilliopsis zonata CBS 506.65]OJJ43869.1 hypothetical protein ASPZODRAFT_145805 [Penicilliopsis zonata CBS 506.65]